MSSVTNSWCSFQLCCCSCFHINNSHSYFIETILNVSVSAPRSSVTWVGLHNRAVSKCWSAARQMLLETTDGLFLRDLPNTLVSLWYYSTSSLAFQKQMWKNPTYLNCMKTKVSLTCFNCTTPLNNSMLVSMASVITYKVMLLGTGKEIKYTHYVLENSTSEMDLRNLLNVELPINKLLM